MCFHLSLSLLRFSYASTSSGLEGGGRPLLNVFHFLIASSFCISFSLLDSSFILQIDLRFYVGSLEFF